MIDYEQIENTIGYEFNNRDLLQQAFVRRSYSQENGGGNNELLEFIGDKALDLAIIRLLTHEYCRITEEKEYGYRELVPIKYKGAPYDKETEEGRLTDLKKELVQKKALSKCIDKLGFHTQLIMGKGDIQQSVQESDSVKEDLFEAIVGAVAVDSNFDMDSISTAVENMIDFWAIFDGRNDELDNYVGMIQEWSQKNGYGLPSYTYSSLGRNDPRGTFCCQLIIKGGNDYYNWEGYSESRAAARKEVAQIAYEDLVYRGLIQDKFESEVGEPDRVEAIRQVNELYQKKLIAKPVYEFKERHDRNGNPYWNCELTVDGYWEDNAHSCYNKKESQRECAYQFLCYLMGYDYKEE